MSNLDEISVAIGKQTAQIETLIYEVEQMKEEMKNPPLSKNETDQYAILDKRLSKIELTLAKTAGYIAALTSGAIVSLKWVAELLGIIPLNGPHS